MNEAHQALAAVDDLDRALRRGADGDDPDAAGVAALVGIGTDEASALLMTAETLGWIVENTDRAARYGDGFEAKFWRLTPSGAHELARG